MSIILNIDTAVHTSSVCLAENNRSIGVQFNPSPKDSASWLHTAIDLILKENQIEPSRLDAIAVTEGPGSYTGLRVGMATAKGLSYALGKPLILINTLEMMAFAAADGSTDLICPMIDARRLEVFTAVYDQQLRPVVSPKNMILNESSFADLLQTKTMLFFGNGSPKFGSLCSNPHAVFKEIGVTAANMPTLSSRRFESRNFADLAYAEPFYGKDFHSSNK